MLEILTGRLYLLVLLEHPNQKWNLGWNVVYTCAENLDITSWTTPFLLYLLEFLIFWYLSFRPTLEKKNVSCDDRVSVSWCLFVELKYSTSHWLLQNIPARGLWRIWNDFGIVIIVISRSSFQLKLHHRKSEQKRRSQSFSEVSSSLRGFYEMVLVQNALWQVSENLGSEKKAKRKYSRKTVTSWI